MIDLFCGRGGWTKGFLANGWEVRGYDLNPQPDYPQAAEFIQADVLELTADDLQDADFICCSSPCEEFSVHCMKHFHPNPKFPALGIKLFDHSREICEASGKPYIMENVRCAEKFVGRAVNHCGPFYLWGSGVPLLFNQGISKAKWLPNAEHGRHGKPGNFAAELLLSKPDRKAKLATIPIELSQCAAEHANRILARSERGGF